MFVVFLLVRTTILELQPIQVGYEKHEAPVLCSSVDKKCLKLIEEEKQIQKKVNLKEIFFQLLKRQFHFYRDGIQRSVHKMHCCHYSIIACESKVASLRLHRICKNIHNIIFLIREKIHFILYSSHSNHSTYVP